MNSEPNKRMAIISQYYRPEIGAPQNRLFEMAIGLKSYGWAINVITAMPNYPKGKIYPKYRGKLRIRELVDDISVIRYWLFASKSKRAFPRIISMLSFSFMVLFSLGHLKRGKFDYLLIESPPITLGLSGYLLSRICRVKLLLNISDLWPLTAHEMGAISDGFLYNRLLGLERFLYRKSHICLGQSQEIVDYLKMHGSVRTYLFRNGVDPERFEVQDKAGPGTNPRIVYAGLLGIAQGITDICRTIHFQELGVDFHIYGDGPEREELEIFLKENQDRGIFYHGSVLREEIPGLMQNFSATLIPLNKSIYGAVPSKIYESMAAGLPIFFSGEGEARLIIEEHKLGWTSSARDYTALANNISMLNENRLVWKEKRENCLHAARGMFNRPNQIGKLHEFLSTE